MKNRSRIILGITILFVFASVLLSSCSNEKADEGIVESNTPKTQKAGDSNNLSNGAMTKSATTAPVSTTSTSSAPTATASASGVGAPTRNPKINKKTQPDVSQMSVIFPKELNLEWRYGDAKAFGYKMRTLNLSDTEGGKILKCVGIFKDSVPNGKGVVFNSEYYIYPDGIKEVLTTAANVFPNPIKNMMIIKSPLEKNTFWEQEVKINGGNTAVKLEGKIFDVINDGGKKVYQIRYAAKVDGYPNNLYMEERHFKEGSGLINYACIDKTGKVFNYSMDKIATYVAPK